MTAFVAGSGPQVDDSYALFSPDARFARSQVVVSAPPPLCAESMIIRTIEFRQRPFAPVLHKLDVFESLPEDWDSYGAARVSSAALMTARAIVNDLSYRPASFGGMDLVPFSVAPVATGGIKVEWRHGVDALELWIDSSGAIEAVIDRRNSDPRFEEKAPSSIPAAISEVLTFAA